MEQYEVLMHNETYRKAASYLEELETGTTDAGSYFRQSLKECDKDNLQLTVDEFIDLLVGTKRPQIFAESAVHGDGSDWNRIELSILGDISIAVPVTVFDDGRHFTPRVHATPFGATLLFTPGALLRSGTNDTPTDWEECYHQR